MKFMVTGGAGFVGSHVVDALIKEGHKVSVIDNLISGKKENINPRADFYQLDIADEKTIDSLFKDIDGVFHVAALARIQHSFSEPHLYFRSNVVGTHNVIMAARKHGVKRVVFSASSSAYGRSDNLPLHEDHKVHTQALNPYTSTKRMGEMMMHDLGKSTGGPETVCLRYFNVFGPRQLAIADGPYATVIGIFLELLNNGKPLTIVPDGHQRRDFTWVGDVVKANLSAMNSPNVGDAEIINIGSGQSHSIWDVVRLILGVPQTISEDDLIKSGKCVLVSKRRNEVQETLAHIAKAKKLLGWEPRVKFADGIKYLLDCEKNKSSNITYKEL